MPTLAAAAGASLPEDRIIDGRNMLPVAMGERESVERENDALFWSSGFYKAVRAGNWKLQLNERQDRRWLFNLAEDPTEQNNLAEQGPTSLQRWKPLSRHTGPMPVRHFIRTSPRVRSASTRPSSIGLAMKATTSSGRTKHDIRVVPPAARQRWRAARGRRKRKGLAEELPGWLCVSTCRCDAVRLLQSNLFAKRDLMPLLRGDLPERLQHNVNQFILL
ncbi:MAG: hypothetical protein U5K56_17455 [Halioglobus sp.]|nr:hypothetical protein [Halioglobus sp.]